MIKIISSNVRGGFSRAYAKYGLLNDQHRELQQAYEEKTRHATTFEEKYRTEKNIVIKTQEALKQSQDKIKALRHNYQFIVEEKAGLQGQLELLRTGGKKLLRTG